MATSWTLTFEGEPTEADFRRVAEMTAQGFTSGQLINDPGAEFEEGPATGYYAKQPHVCQDPAYGPCPRPECGAPWR